MPKPKPLRIVLVHWKPGEVVEQVDDLERAGHAVTTYSNQMGTGLGVYLDAPPDVAVISLERLPSHGRAIAHWFRTKKATRSVPLVFVGGAEDKVEATRAMFADAVFSSWDRVLPALRTAARTPQRAAPTPACSTKELWQKLEIQDGGTVALLGAPPRFEKKALAGMPESVVVKRQARGAADLAVLFPKSASDLAARWPAATAMLDDKPRVWIAWPKLASGVRSEVTQDLVLGFGRDQGWTDIKVCRIDDTWSGLLFAPRRNGSRAKHR